MQQKNFSIRETLDRSFGMIQEQLGLFVGATLIFFVILIVLGSLVNKNSPMVYVFLIQLVTAVVQIVFYFNLVTIGFKKFRGEKIQFKDFYSDGTFKTYLNFIGMFILKMLLMVPITAIGTILLLLAIRSNIFLVPVFALLFMIAVFYCLAVVFFAAPAVVSGLSPMQSIRKSVELSRDVRGKIVLFCIVMIVIVSISCIPLGLGLLVVYPLFPIATVCIYQKLDGAALSNNPVKSS